MAFEIERKFLVKGEFRHLSTGSYDITQAYIAVEPGKTIRIRITDNKAFLTIKTPMLPYSFIRNEWEYEIPREDAVEMLKICVPGKVIKTRYLIPAGERQFEVDVFHDRNEGLIIAEIELGSETEKFEIPAWLGEEVTGNPAYYNSNLIK
jgi:CYTH domain-containing protein